MNSVSTTIVFVLMRFIKLSVLMQVNSAISPLPTRALGALAEIPCTLPALLSESS